MSERRGTRGEREGRTGDFECSLERDGRARVGGEGAGGGRHCRVVGEFGCARGREDQRSSGEGERRRETGGGRRLTGSPEGGRERGRQGGWERMKKKEEKREKERN